LAYADSTKVKVGKYRFQINTAVRIYNYSLSAKGVIPKDMSFLTL
jgi:hypothetical protein